MARHWKKFMDKELLGAHDLDGRDVTVVIVEVDGGEISNGNKKNKRPIAKIASQNGRPLEKKLALNATNCRTLEQLSGSPDVDKWRGLPVVLFGTTTQFGGQTVDCIRIRPYPPKDNGKGRSGNGRGGRNEPTAPPNDAPANDLSADDAAMAARDAEDVPGVEAGGTDA
jgi:hypothetical protein